MLNDSYNEPMFRIKHAVKKEYEDELVEFANDVQYSSGKDGIEEDRFKIKSLVEITDVLLDPMNNKNIDFNALYTIFNEASRMQLILSTFYEYMNDKHIKDFSVDTIDKFIKNGKEWL